MIRTEYRALLSVDAEKSSGRNEAARKAVREVVFEAVGESVIHAGVAWSACLIKDNGDGVRVVAPPGTRKVDLVHAVIHHLIPRLRQHNHAEGQGSNKVIRVRVALHAGELEVPDRGSEDDRAVDGRPLEALARLLDCDLVREALRAAPANTPLALIMSDHYYEDSVRYGSSAVLPQDFTRHAIAVKEYVGDAWLFVPAFAVGARAAITTATDHTGGNVPTDDEIAVLSAAAASTVVSAMATDSWTGLKTLVRRLLQRTGGERARAAEQRLDTDARLVEGARDPETARRDLAGAWSAELASLLRADPQCAPELRKLIAAGAASGPAQPGTENIHVYTNVGQGATAAIVGKGHIHQYPVPAPWPPVPRPQAAAGGSAEAAEANGRGGGMSARPGAAGEPGRPPAEPTVLPT